MIKEFDKIVLNKNLPALRLKKGDLGVVVMIYPNRMAYEVEFMTLDDKTIAVETLSASDVLQIQPKAVAHVRNLKGSLRRKVTK